MFTPTYVSFDLKDHHLMSIQAITPEQILKQSTSMRSL